MAKKIRDEQGNVYVQKKPFYRRGCFIFLAIIVIAIALGSIFGGNSQKESTTSDSNSTTQQSNSGETSEQESESTSNFTPQDVSDQTINTIKTYGDYLDMYTYVVTDYLSYYQAKLEESGLTDEQTQAEFEQSKKEIEEELEEVKKEYGPMKNMPIPEGAGLAEILIAQRDMLRASVDAAFAAY